MTRSTAFLALSLLAPGAALACDDVALSVGETTSLYADADADLRLRGETAAEVVQRSDDRITVKGVTAGATRIDLDRACYDVVVQPKQQKRAVRSGRHLVLLEGDVVRLVPGQQLTVERTAGESVGLSVTRQEGTTIELVAREPGTSSLTLGGEELVVEVRAR